VNDLRAEECTRLAETARTPSAKADYLAMEQRWLSLARSYEFAEQLSRFTEPEAGGDGGSGPPDVTGTVIDHSTRHPASGFQVVSGFCLEAHATKVIAAQHTITKPMRPPSLGGPISFRSLKAIAKWIETICCLANTSSRAKASAGPN
jgi:hypothetical protein